MLLELVDWSYRKLTHLNAGGHAFAADGMKGA